MCESQLGRKTRKGKKKGRNLAAKGAGSRGWGAKGSKSKSFSKPNGTGKSAHTGVFGQKKKMREEARVLGL